VHLHHGLDASLRFAAGRALGADAPQAPPARVLSLRVTIMPSALPRLARARGADRQSLWRLRTRIVSDTDKPQTRLFSTESDGLLPRC